MVTLAVGAIVPNLGLSAGLTAAVGIAGGLLGAYVDQAFVLPTLFPPPDPEPQDISQLQLASFNEGAPINLCIGPQVRVEGQIIWAGRPEYTELVTSVSPGTGKGGGGQKSIQIQYTIDIAVAFCEAPLDSIGGARKINGINKILANGNRLFESASTIVVGPDNKIYCTAFKTAGEHLFIKAALSRRHFPYHYLRISSDDSAGGPSLSNFRTGNDVVVAGFSNTVNNGTYEVTKVGQDPTTGDTFIEVYLGVATTSDTVPLDSTHYPYPLTDPGILKTTGGIDEAVGPSVTLTQTRPNFEAVDAVSITIYDGSQTSPDPLISAWALESAPVHKGMAYAVIEGLNLNNFGNSIPTFTADIEANVAPYYVSEAIEQVLMRSEIGMDLVRIDSALESMEFGGMAIRGTLESTKALQPILTAYDIIAQIDPDGFLRFFRRTDSYRHVIDITDLAVVREGDAADGNPFILEDYDRDRLPTQVVVTHIDPGLDFASAVQKERRVSDGAEMVQQISLPMTLTPTEAKGVASRVLWVQASSHGKFALQLPHKYAKISESDQVEFTKDGKTWYGFVDRAERGDNYAIRLECTEINPNAIFHTVSVDLKNSKIVPGQRANQGPAVRMSAADIPSLVEAQNTKSGLYYWANSYSVVEPWFGALVEVRNVDASEPYEPLGALPTEAYFGIMEDSLGPPPGVTGDYMGAWDWRLNSTGPVVEMMSGLTGLGSATTQDILHKGYNKALIGNEIVHFKLATSLGNDRYRLDGFIRGVQGTEDQFDLHAIGDRFLLINSNGNQQFPAFGGIEFEDFGLKNLDALYGFLGSSDTRNAAVTNPFYVEANGETLKPLPIGWYQTFRWFGGQVGLSFFATSRRFGATFMQVPSDLRLFEIDVMSGSTVLNTYKIDDTGGSNTPGKIGQIVNWVYTAAQQARDGISPGSTVTLQIYQVNPEVGRGKMKEVVIT